MQAYDAYSIALTGRDHWGEFFPVRPECFGEYCYPALTYLAAPFALLLGPTELAVRLPVAILNSLIPVAIALFLLKITKNRLSSYGAGALTALNPAMIVASRIAFHASIVQVFTTLCLLLVTAGKFTKKNIAVSGALAALAYYAYPTAVPFAILVVAPIVIIRAITEKKSLEALAFPLTFAVLSIPLIAFAVMHPSYDAFRRDQVTIFDPRGALNANHEKWYEILPRHYAAYFRIDYLLQPFSEIRNAPFLTVPLAILVLAGILFALVSLWSGSRETWCIALVLWFFLGFLPAAMTFYSPQSYRANTWFPVFFVAAGFGVFALSRISKGLTATLVVLAIGVQALSLGPMLKSWNCSPFFEAGAGWGEAARVYFGDQTWQLEGHPVDVFALTYKRFDPILIQKTYSAVDRNRPNWFSISRLPGLTLCSSSKCSPSGAWQLSSKPMPDAASSIKWCGKDVLYIMKLSK